MLKWEKYIYEKGSNRIDAISQPYYTLSIIDSDDVPDINELKNIRNFVFRIDTDTIQLREAVENCLELLHEKYLGYSFSAIFGGA